MRLSLQHKAASLKPCKLNTLTELNTTCKREGTGCRHGHSVLVKLSTFEAETEAGKRMWGDKQLVINLADKRIKNDLIAFK